MTEKIKFSLAAAFLFLGGVLAAEDVALEKEFFETVRDWENPAELSTVPVMSWQSRCECSILYSSKKFVSYKIYHQSYTGGAHGMSRTRVGTLKNRKQLKLADLPKSVRPMWEKAVAKYFKAASFDAYMKSKPTFKPKMTENFYIDGKGIHFVYDPYEIDCYAAGTVDIFVPCTVK